MKTILIVLGVIYLVVGIVIVYKGIFGRDTTSPEENAEQIEYLQRRRDSRFYERGEVGMKPVKLYDLISYLIDKYDVRGEVEVDHNGKIDIITPDGNILPMVEIIKEFCEVK